MYVVFYTESTVCTIAIQKSASIADAIFSMAIVPRNNIQQHGNSNAAFTMAQTPTKNSSHHSNQPHNNEGNDSGYAGGGGGQQESRKYEESQESEEEDADDADYDDDSSIEENESTDQHSIQDIAKLYHESPEKAKEIIKKAFIHSASIKKNEKHQCKSTAETLDLSDQILEAVVKWFPNREILMLYQRWAKKQKEHFFSDAVSVVKTLVQSAHFPQYKTDLDVLLSITLKYEPSTTKRKLGDYKNSITFVPSVQSRNQNLVDLLGDFQ